MIRNTIVILLLLTTSTKAQTIPQRLTQAIKQFESDPQMRHAIASICVIDAKTGKKIFSHNDQTGLAPASTQKIFTSIAAFELLGKDFRYKTTLGYEGEISNKSLNGSLIITGSGDPSFGSWRWKSTSDTVILEKWKAAVNKAGISAVSGTIHVDESIFTHQGIPDGWIWQDIGNYYGAGAYALNWHENQYDLHLRSGSKIGDDVEVLDEGKKYINELYSAAQGTGDNAWIYPALGEHRNALVKGTIPINEKKFTISGATIDPATEFIILLGLYLSGSGTGVNPYEGEGRDFYWHKKDFKDVKVLDTHLSPPLDSLNYYFMRRSINLYGEALVKTIAAQKERPADTEKGIDILRDFCSAIGIEKSAINIIDGSGLSPQNRVTTSSQVKALQYARSRPWFQSFYHSLPEYNGMKMKSGSIGGARAYAGYHISKAGKEYIFSIIVNNYDGSASDVVRKMYRVLDVLK